MKTGCRLVFELGFRDQKMKERTPKFMKETGEDQIHEHLHRVP